MPYSSDELPIVRFSGLNDTYAVNQTIYYSVFYDGSQYRCTEWHAYVTFANNTKTSALDTYYNPICGFSQPEASESFQVPLKPTFRISHDGNYTLTVDIDSATEYSRPFQVQSANPHNQ